eukprot:CAMPEP_0203848638 /NCGR_PEP_ID=MMETSP0359-20131031/5709_1 /ASSEMBLY_ACC=CAM_ASM_000338 /TAXON_ID=268821 /ORGANISM="Scrippsiella Hangoei, Strain SHTV-5" /LENGTH=733 /DNA_ID=CAMNT_0050764263 /DNA_START=13 /DNA_END=2211 /DNA_ORIENTATION=+
MAEAVDIGDSMDLCCPGLADDLERLAFRHGVPFRREVVQSAFRRHGAFFVGPGSHVQLRLSRWRDKTSGQLRRQLNFRAELLVDASGGPSRAEVALRSALEQDDKTYSKSAREYLLNVLSAFPTGATGADFDPDSGLVKLWHFGRHSVDELAALDGAPEALSSLQPLLQRYGLRRVFCVGIDLHNASSNFYFRLHEGGRQSAADVGALLRDLGLAEPCDEDTLRYISGPGTLAITLSWGSVACERACLYVVPSVLPTAAASPSELPAMPGYVKAFMDESALPVGPADLDRPHPLNSCFVSCSFGREPGCEHLKQESDWRGSYHDFLQRVAAFVGGSPASGSSALSSGAGAGAGAGGGRAGGRGQGRDLLTLVRQTVAAVAPGGDLLEDDTPLTDLGLDSATAAFLRGQLVQQTGTSLPGSAVFDRPTIAGLAALLEEASPGSSARIAASPPPDGHSSAEAAAARAEERSPPPSAGARSSPAASPRKRRALASSPELRVRFATDADWPGLQALWREHHHLRDAVGSTTRAFLSGPLGVVAIVGAAAVPGFRRGSLSVGAALLGLGVYLSFVLAQHVVHWLCALAVLKADLSSGDLTARAWCAAAERGSGCGPLAGTEARTALLAEATDEFGRVHIAGIVCVRLGSIWAAAPRKPGSARQGGPASLWHAAVEPRFRGSGVASLLLRAAERWAEQAGADYLEVMCLNLKAKAVCWNSGWPPARPADLETEETSAAR